MFLVAPHIAEGNLMRAPGALHRLAVDLVRAAPSLRGAQHDHRPRPSLTVDGGGTHVRDAVERTIERDGEPLMRCRMRLRCFDRDEDRIVAVSGHQRRQFLLRDPCEHCRVGDLPTVQVQDRQHHAVAARIEKPVAVPCGGQRPGLRFAVADDADDGEVRVVEGRAERVRKRVPEFAALLNGPGCFRGGMAGHATRVRELLEEPAHAVGVSRHVGVELRIAAVQPGVRVHRWAAVAWSGDEQHGLIPLHDDTVQVCVDEVQPRYGAEVAQQTRLDVGGRERTFEHRVILQIDLPDAQIVRRAPPVVDPVEGFLVHSHDPLDTHARGRCQGG